MVYQVVDNPEIEVFRKYSNMEYGRGTSEIYSIEMLVAVLCGVIRSEEVKLELFIICESFVKGSISGYVFNWESVLVDSETYTWE